MNTATLKFSTAPFRIFLAALALSCALALMPAPAHAQTYSGLSIGDLSATAVTKSVSCPPVSTWLAGLVPGGYDQCYSSDKNWSTTGIPDYQLLDTKDNISVQFSAALAGSIASVKVGGQEYISSQGHGSAFTYDVHPNAPSPSWCPPSVPNCVATECYNPTEEGAVQDDYRDITGNPLVVSASTPLANGQPQGQLHGPSTSDILSYAAPYWHGGTQTTPLPYAWFHSNVRLANFIPDNAIPSASQCQTHFQNTPPYSAGLSHYILDKETRLGSLETTDGHLIGGGYPVLAFNATLNIEAGEPTSPNFDFDNVAYLTSDFQTFYHLPAGCAGTTCLEDITKNVQATASSTSGSVSLDPLIVAKDSAHAIGMFAVMPSGEGEHSHPQYFIGYGDGTNPITPWAYRYLSVSFFSKNVSPGSINYKTYYVVGSLAQVTATIADLHANPDVLWSGTPSASPQPTPTGTLTATPNPCTIKSGRSSCATALVWSTPDTSACVFYSADQNGTPGRWCLNDDTANPYEPSWITPSGVTFTLRAFDDPSAPAIASVTVTGAASASSSTITPTSSITASPNPCLIASNASTCATGLSWSAPNTPNACLFYSADANGRPGRWCVASTTSPYWPNWITTNGITFTLRSYDDPNAPALSAVTVKGTASCPTITHNLYLGSTDTTTGGQVTQLQQFLGGQVTGYFGYQTRDLVKQWQAAHGIISSGTARTTGWGVVGPKTRAAIATSCGNNLQPQPQQQPSPISFSATPTSGSAPLAVTFTGSVNSFSNYTIDFGDGQTQTNASCPSSAPWGQFPCQLSPVAHTYAQAGTYVAKLIQANYCGPSYSGTCTSVPTTLGSATITVGGSASTPAPTATFTANGLSEITANVGDTINYLWSSTYAVSANSTYTVDSTACKVAGGVATAWVATTLSGSKIFGQILPCEAGHTYTITYTATNSAGVSASATVIVHVNQITTTTASGSAATATTTTTTGTITATPNPCTIANGASTCTTKLVWSTTNDPTACVFYSADQNGSPGRWCLPDNTATPYYPNWITTNGITFTLRTYDNPNAPALSSVTVKGVATSTASNNPSSLSASVSNVNVEALNRNLAAAIAAPFSLLVDGLSQMFLALGMY